MLATVVRRAAVVTAVAFLLQPLAAGAQPAPAPTPAPAPPTKPAGKVDTVTLGGVLQTAVRQNPGLVLASIDIDVAEAQVLQATGVFDWNLDATLSWNSSRIGGIANDVTSVTSRDNLTGQISLTRLLAGGASFGIHARSSFSTTAFNLVPDPARRFDESVFLSYTQPLLEGRGERVANANVRIRRASLTAAGKDREAQAITVVRGVVVAYWELVYALHDLDIRRSSLELAKEQLRLTNLRIAAGSTAKIEATAVEQTIANREEEILRAELAVTQRSLELRRLAGMPIGPRAMDLYTAAPLSVKQRTLDLNALVAASMSFSPELAALHAQKDIDTINVEVTDNGLLPRLDLSVTVGPNGAASRGRDALEQMVRLDGFNVGATLTFRHAFGNRSARGAYHVARTRLTRTRMSMVDVKAQIALAVATAKKQADIAKKRIDLSQRAIVLATQNIEAEKGRFELGKSTNFDVAQRQEELKQFQLRYARATIDYLLALTAIDALTGDLLTRLGIKLSK